MVRFLSVIALGLATLPCSAPCSAQAAPFTTAAEVKPILLATKGNWVSVREFDGEDLLYVTHLWSWRCGLSGMRIGINGALPEARVVPPCHLDLATPNAILEHDGLPFRRYPLQSITRISIDLLFDDETVETITVNRAGQPVSP
jgi:hypothetical protein